MSESHLLWVCDGPNGVVTIFFGWFSPDSNQSQMLCISLCLYALQSINYWIGRWLLISCLCVYCGCCCVLKWSWNFFHPSSCIRIPMELKKWLCSFKVRKEKKNLVVEANHPSLSSWCWDVFYSLLPAVVESDEFQPRSSHITLICRPWLLASFSPAINPEIIGGWEQRLDDLLSK